LVALGTRGRTDSTTASLASSCLPPLLHTFGELVAHICDRQISDGTFIVLAVFRSGHALHSELEQTRSTIASSDLSAAGSHIAISSPFLPTNTSALGCVLPCLGVEHTKPISKSTASRCVNTGDGSGEAHEACRLLSVGSRRPVGRYNTWSPLRLYRHASRSAGIRDCLLELSTQVSIFSLGHNS
jgi:hypothetical protein